jgi:hypothetical protein
MDRNAIPRANDLLNYYRDTLRAIEVLDQGATVQEFTVAVVATNDEDVTIVNDDTRHTIPAAGIPVPPQMLTAIKSQLQTRRGEIEQQLRQLGVTP